MSPLFIVFNVLFWSKFDVLFKSEFNVLLMFVSNVLLMFDVLFEFEVLSL
jgi:hypothetical protein